MGEIIVYFVLVVGLILALSENACMLIAHGLNNLFGLNHPGPNDIQGTCWCRRHEGPDKYSFGDFMKSFVQKRD